MDTGTRWAGNASPRDLTKRRQQELLAETARKRAAAGIDPAELRKQAYAAGADAGWNTGWTALATALHALYRSEGIEAIMEFLAELDDADGGAE